MDRFILQQREECTGGEDNESPRPSTVTRNEPAKKIKTVVRKYDDTYLKFGFSFSGTYEYPLPQCVICYEILANECLKPSKLERHLKQKHSTLQNKPLEFFVRKKNELSKQRSVLEKATTQIEKGLKASYLVALRIAKCKKPHTIGEDLILPSAQDMCREVLGEEAARKIGSIPLSNNTVCRLISEMSINVKVQLIEMIRNVRYFALQLDETTDVANLAQLMIYVRFMHKNKLTEELLFCKELPTRTTGAEIFQLLNDFITSNSLDWKKYVGICTDGAAAMTGKRSGVVARVREVAPNVTATHCILHRQALALKEMNEELHDVLNSVIKIVNFVKSNPFNSRLFSALCAEMGAGHEHVLFHSEVRWLSKGKVVKRVYELRDELKELLQHCGSPLAEHLMDSLFLSRLAYLADIFSEINELNLALQGHGGHLLAQEDKIRAFKKKISIWENRIQASVTEMFPLLTDVLQIHPCHSSSLKQTIVQHLKKLEEKLIHYFPSLQTEPSSEYDWIRNPFAVPVETQSHLNVYQQGELAEISCDKSLQLRFSSIHLAEFWVSVQTEYPALSDEALKVLLPFATTYLCEAGFSALTAIKTNYRARLKIEDEIRLSLTNICPQLEKLCKEKQAHPSH
ncbi:SCAN domain-containing protein 3-like [Latimeria chalumnae]|uniref:SCAN domain-containing protein 3-like n=1 Tax=Latimeria chalumnae TaxID=7897 RepID=UPI00313D0C21